MIPQRAEPELYCITPMELGTGWADLSGAKVRLYALADEARRAK
jgi:hypothetical protein